MKKAFLIAAGTLLLGACSDLPSGPSTKAPTAARRDLICESGYEVAQDENGNDYCAPLPPPPPPEGQGMRSAPRTFADTTRL